MEHKQRILIVDDRPENLFTLRRVLQDIGPDIEIIEAANGNEALIATLNYDFAVVILDVQMPDIDGYEVAEFIRNEPKTRFLPIVFLSAIFSDDFHVFKGYRAGGVDFMTKPFEPEILLSKVRVFLDLDRQRFEVKQRNAELEQALETVNTLNIRLQTQTRALDQSAAVSIINREGAITYVNDLFCRSSGYSSSEIVGSDFRLLSREMYSDRFFLRAVAQVSAGKMWRGEIRCKAKDGRIFWMDSSVVPFNDSEGKPFQFLNIRFDITDRKIFETELRDKNHEIERKNRNITASINYAKRIQEAMLPPISEIYSALPESFVMYRPKEVVSGDFYWHGKKDGKTIIAAVDCTGHGVPGAFMSLIANDLLHQIIILKGVTSPDLILNELRKEIIGALSQEKTENRDGMDMAVCVIDKENKLLEFAGAKNPLVAVSGGEMTEYKGDKFSIGGFRKKYRAETAFTKQSIPVFRGEAICCYLFSDGYQDQFSGHSGKKYGKSNFRNLLQKNWSKPFEEQKHLLTTELVEWMGDESQIDDVLVVGFRLPPTVSG